MTSPEPEVAPIDLPPSVEPPHSLGVSPINSEGGLPELSRDAVRQIEQPKSDTAHANGSRAKIKVDVRLYDDNNPAGLDPEKLTILYRRYGLGESAEETAKALYILDGDNYDYLLTRVNGFTDRSKRLVLSSIESGVDISRYGARVASLWNQLQLKPHLKWKKTPEHISAWQALLNLADPPNTSEVKKGVRDTSQFPRLSAGSYSISLSEFRRLVRLPLPALCPRCRTVGAVLRLEKDWYSSFLTCLCGIHIEIISGDETLPLDPEELETGGQRQRRRQPSHGKIRL